MGYKEIYDLSVSAEFTHRLQIACISCAVAVSQSAKPDNPAYEEYMRWARFVFSLPSRASQIAAGFVIMNPKIYGGNFTDADLYGAVAEVIPQLVALAPDVRPQLPGGQMPAPSV